MAMAFVIEPSEVQAMLSSSSLTMEALLSKLVAPAKALARPPISHYFVGAVGLGSSGRIFLGVNLEFEGLPLSNSVHAEQFLVANAAQHGETSLLMIAVSAAPCGHCRQFLQELRGAPDLRVLIVDADAETQTLAHLLPHRFGPNDVLDGEFPLILEPRQNGLSLLAHGIVKNAGWSGADAHKGSSDCDGNGNLNSLQDLGSNCNAQSYCKSSVEVDCQCEVGRCTLDSSKILVDLATHGRERVEVDGGFSTPDLKFAALEAANRAHAPYTKCPSGIALLTRKGRVYSGSYLESVAYNPSLPPLQAALVAFVARDGGNYQDITQAILVEKEGAVMQFAATTEVLIKKISPTCNFQTYHASMQEA